MRHFDLYLDGEHAATFGTREAAIAHARKWAPVSAYVISREYFPEFDFCESYTTWESA